jgi:hypothetical protein
MAHLTQFNLLKTNQLKKRWRIHGAFVAHYKAKLLHHFASM